MRTNQIATFLQCDWSGKRFASKHRWKPRPCPTSNILIIAENLMVQRDFNVVYVDLISELFTTNWLTFIRAMPVKKFLSAEKIKKNTRKFMRTNQIVTFHQFCHVIGRASACFFLLSRAIPPFRSLFPWPFCLPSLSSTLPSSPYSLLSCFPPFFPACTFLSLVYLSFLCTLPLRAIVSTHFSPLSHIVFCLFTFALLSPYCFALAPPLSRA